MGSSFFLSLTNLILLSFTSLTSSGSISIHSITPNFTASYFQFADQNGTFLLSLNRTFQASISNPPPRPSDDYYFSITHVASCAVIWTANRNAPMSNSHKLSLTINGLKITTESADEVLWSTPPLTSKVAALQLLESGNLVLVDARNVTLWESFEYPTDTIVMGQRFSVGKSLQSFVSDEDMSVGNYELAVTDNDVVLQWKGLTFWKLSLDTAKANYKVSNTTVSFMEMNGTSLDLLGSDGYTVVYHVALPLAGPSNFRVGKLGSDSDGRFSITNFKADSWATEFAVPVEFCSIPYSCRRLGLCTNKPLGGTCSTPPGFRIDHQNGNYVPANTSLFLPSPCNGNQLNFSVSYLRLGDDVDYFAIDFMGLPMKHGVNLSVCQDLCSQNCSCLGIFHGNSSATCYLLENHIGSLMLVPPKKITHRLGYIKTLVMNSSPEKPIEENVIKHGKHNFPIAGLILLPSSGVIFILVVTIVILWLRKNRLSKTITLVLSQSNSSSSAEFETISIPGLPRRFDYEELASATENFKTHIGIGGFGTVYKGILSDKTVVAVKKITSLGVQGKKEFCTEIAIIGNVHHVNLVRLKGFCAQGSRHRLLVLEYMNKGSLDRTLFGNGPVLEWRERLEIALGTARGLAYLHSGCEHRIIHCDVKPENILLDDNLQVKISDFGLSKLISPEQSNQFTTMRGTRGYLAPEWLTSSSISDKTDVYSYGMVLLEIVRGRKNSSLQTWSHGNSTEKNDSSGRNGPSSPSSGSEVVFQPIYFPLLALEMHEQRRYLELADPRLDGRVTSEEVEKLVRVALCCVHEEPALRPTMNNVVGMLEGGLPLGDPKIESLNFLRFYGRRFTETSRMERYNEQNELELYPHMKATSNSAISGSYNSNSYISSQQLSGPR